MVRYTIVAFVLLVSLVYVMSLPVSNETPATKDIDVVEHGGSEEPSTDSKKVKRSFYGPGYGFGFGYYPFYKFYPYGGYYGGYGFGYHHYYPYFPLGWKYGFIW